MKSVAAYLPLVVAVLVYLLLPLVLVLTEAWAEARPGGFGRGAGELIRLGGVSLFYAMAPALVASALCTAASLFGLFHRTWRSCYGGWLFLLLFTNPVFLVFGFSVILARWPSSWAVLAATTYVLVPLTGLVIGAGVDKYPQAEIHAARSLGASPVYIATRHVLPRVAASIRASIVLATLYAVGFYIVPALVGIGRVSTLGVAIDKTANAVGDRAAACQLCVIAMALQAVVLLLWRFSSRLGHTAERTA